MRKHDKPDDDDEPSDGEKEMTLRLLASAAGLPRVCTVKRCRRRKRCFGNWNTPRAHDIPCLRHHHGLMRARFAYALAQLGWDKLL